MASVLWKRGRLYVRLKGNRTPGKWSAHPAVGCTTEEEAQRYADRRQAAINQRYKRRAAKNWTPPAPKRLPRARIDDDGFVYAVQLLPDLAPNRIKIGFTTSSIDRRLSQHRVTCPALKVVAHWKATRRDETRAHRVVVGRVGLSEVFDVADVAAALSTLDALLGERL